MALLEINNLMLHFTTNLGKNRAVDDVSFTIESGETLGLVGESGCGKSTLGKAVMRLIEPTSGTIRLDGVDISELSQRQLVAYRHKMQMIFQDPFASLNPRARVGRIIEEPMIVNGWEKKKRKDRVLMLLDKVGLTIDSLHRYPHEYSGGQRQRIGIARALALNPSIIICDEAVSSLDVSIRAQIINLLSDLRDEMGLTLLFISHDLSTVKHIADRVAVMYLGKIVEIAETDKLWTTPQHPYSQLLMSVQTVPDPHRARGRKRNILRGELPGPYDLNQGCNFQTRCPHTQGKCRSIEPALIAVDSAQAVACHVRVMGND